MAVHVPLSKRAIEESKKLMLASRNVLSSANGRPVPVPSQEMILGLHYLTRVRNFALGEGTVFASVQEVVSAYQCKCVALHARIKVRLAGTIITTTVGRVLFYEALPEGSDFDCPPTECVHDETCHDSNEIDWQSIVSMLVQLHCLGCFAT